MRDEEEQRSNSKYLLHCISMISAMEALNSFTRLILFSIEPKDPDLEYRYASSLERNMHGNLIISIVSHNRRRCRCAHSLST